MTRQHPHDRDVHPQTRAVHPQVITPATSRPLGVPIYQGHLFGFDSADTLAQSFASPDEAFMYARTGNPTVRSFERAAAELEGGAGAHATASGMGAVNAVLMALLRSGDHVIAQSSLYGGSYALLHDLADRWGVELTHIPGDDPDEARAALRPNTRLLYLETISNPVTHVTDIPAFAGAVRDAGVLTVVDNTFAPLLCRPIEHGADVVVHSVTKFIGGHGDLIGGAAVFADADVHRRVWKHAVELGATADPFAAWLAIRGLATLPMRVARQSASALDIARRLAAHPAVARVHYPGLPGHPQHDLARRLLPDGSGGVMAFDPAGGREAGRVFTEAVRLIALGPSLGAAATLVMHPASTSHRQLDAASLAAAGVGEGTVRLSVGLEHPDDLWADIEQALSKAA
ncbi:aminotransferase class I/II-fold pyridoxal phosphate-dependent enzyme [Actinomadura graeca]|uniref:Aminotransferase class I/II-fold pyridoxal phosphate-dependent enzyme n=1 Tax=Actinomadura graeca TaxID=2750812 RepID=A0ABX8QSF9_9ACTN|nr:aminotransferase class I/II-fold pyridoxal phosphate-dependent enzyme [Actinomadura graeca]QXJ21646.1 aminotransferase class I/II-fold pyridoxal phosphate-dependent enzyme [Actinomadura graeca]